MHIISPNMENNAPGWFSRKRRGYYRNAHPSRNENTPKKKGKKADIKTL